MDWLVSEIASLLLDLSKDTFSGFRGRIRLYRIKKRLHYNLFETILKEYGNKEYYNDLDHFLSENRVIYNIIINCVDTPVNQYRSKTQIIQHNIKCFIETNPRFSRYEPEIYQLLQKCFDTIFNTLNSSNTSENVRIICNVTKELSSEILQKLEDINSALFDMKKGLDTLKASESVQQNEVPIFFQKQYFECQARLFTSQTSSGYISRSLYNDSSKNDLDSLDALLSERRILLLGEAGYGKTYESIALLNKACTSSKAVNLLPVYLPLYEYGMVYSTITEGIEYKISPFCEGNPQELIKSWFSTGKLLIILDGMDDIQSEELRTKFVVETKSLAMQHDKCYMFITSRRNRYHGEFGNIKEYSIGRISQSEIHKQLIDEGILVKIPRNYYQLFENPLFLEVGKVVLKKSTHHDLFNRSMLFEQLVLLLCDQWDKKKGISSKRKLCCSEIIDILGQYAYETFNKPYSKYLEFEEHISKILPIDTNKTEIIDMLLSSGFLKVSGGICFTHKLFKEFFTACYLVSHYPLTDNPTMYLEYVNKDEWKEVLVFASGLQKDIIIQDKYLDFIMQNNLQLYIECIDAKSDLSVQLASHHNLIAAKRYLDQIVITYSYIIDKYFSPISSRFDPTLGITERDTCRKKIQIVGSLSPDGEILHYWFNRVMSNEPSTICINENQIAEFFKDHEKQAAFERKRITAYAIDLKLSGLRGDSGRKIAVGLIKKQIKSIIEKKELIESNYLLCERVNDYKRKIKELKDISDIDQMETVVEAMVQSAKEQTENIVGYTCHDIRMFNFLTLLRYLKDRSIVFSNYILPSSDLHKPSGWVWDGYSENQMAKRVSKFFYFHQLSYIEMVQTNFPHLCHSFSRYLDTPYQNIILIDLKKDSEPTSQMSDPSLLYYYIASPSKHPIEPQLKYVDGASVHSTSSDLSDSIYQQIQQSYLQSGQTAHQLVLEYVGFKSTVYSMRTGAYNPLSDFVYSSIQESLEQVLGKL